MSSNVRKQVLRVFDHVWNKPACAPTEDGSRNLKFWIKEEEDFVLSMR